jgi:hypothetical protein
MAPGWPGGGRTAGRGRLRWHTPARRTHNASRDLYPRDLASRRPCHAAAPHVFRGSLRPTMERQARSCSSSSTSVWPANTFASIVARADTNWRGSKCRKGCECHPGYPAARPPDAHRPVSSGALQAASGAYQLGRRACAVVAPYLGRMLTQCAFSFGPKTSFHQAAYA